MATSPDFEDTKDLQRDAIPIETPSKDVGKDRKVSVGNSKEKKCVDDTRPAAVSPFQQNFAPGCNIKVHNITAAEIGNLHIGEVINLNGRPKKKNRKYKPQVEIPKDILESQKVVNEENIDIVKENIAKEWKDLGRKLGLQDPQLDQIYLDNHMYDFSEIIYQMMIKWIQQNGDNATVGRLAVALQRIKKPKVALKLCVD